MPFTEIYFWRSLEDWVSISRERETKTFQKAVSRGNKNIYLSSLIFNASASEIYVESTSTLVASINPFPFLLEDKLIKSAKAIYILGIMIRYFDFKLCLRRKHRGNISPEIVYRRIYATERQCFKNYSKLRLLLISRLSNINANKTSDSAVKFTQLIWVCAYFCVSSSPIVSLLRLPSPERTFFHP